MLNKKVESLTSFAVIASQLSKFDHIPVMLKESIDFLNVQKGGIYVDATLGQGGHSEIIAKLLKGQGKIIGIDQDPKAIKAAKQRLVRFGNLIKFVHNNFKNLEIILNKLNIKKVDGVLLDLGVSNEQLKNPERGFSFSEDIDNLNSKLDMRMNTLQNISAYDVLNKYRENELKDIFLNLGEEHYIYSKKIAKRIVQERTKKPITTVNDLLVIIKSTMPPKYRFRKRSHYASKIFRAIRMEVNQELPALQEIIPQAINKLKKGGRLVIISFHSLEDRIVKKAFREISCSDKSRGPMINPVRNEISNGVKILTKKPLIPSEEEMNNNPKSRSAKLRALEKL